MYELGYSSLLLLLCERKLMTFSKDNTRFEYDVFSGSKQAAAVTECTRKNFFLSASRQLLAASRGSLALGCCEMQKLIYG